MTKTLTQIKTFRRLILQNILLPLVLTAVLCVVFVSQIRSLLEVNQVVAHTEKVIALANEATRYIVDCETGVRGYLLNGGAEFLDPYTRNLPKVKPVLQELRRLAADNPEQIERLNTAETVFENWKAISDIRVKGKTAKKPNRDDAIRAKELMDKVREQMQEVIAMESELRNVRLRDSDSATRSSLTIALSLSALIGLFLAYFGRKQLLALSFGYEEILRTQAEQNESLREQEWLTRGHAGLLDAIRGELSAKEIAGRTLNFLAHFLEAQVGAIYAVQSAKIGAPTFHRVATFALGANENASVASFRKGENLLGQAIQENEIVLIDDVPANYLPISSALGEMRPTSLLLAPLVSDARPVGGLELGFAKAPKDSVKTLLARVSEPVGVAIQSALLRSQQADLLEETQKLNESLQTQQEELRVANEELAEQSRTLQESQIKLSSQQAELEQTNEELEEQSRSLENQKDLVERRNLELLEAQKSLRRQAEELEKGSRYKSEFLANMSHELRTPLNSTLILAKLLADNPNRNLNEEQVRFAETIYSSGNDLLQLINDILDLSKVEAGHLELNPEIISMSRLSASLSTLFGPIAAQKGVDFQIDIDAVIGSQLRTDPLRLEQILKNFLSNAFKFTEKGEVVLRAYRPKDDPKKISFSVRDSGIGIPLEQQEIIFEAFRQADGTTNRKYGGTGLGLSISMELSRLLGGKISVESEPGKGSTFTLTLPEEYVPAERPAPSPASSKAKIAEPRENPPSEPNAQERDIGKAIAASHIRTFGNDDRGKESSSRRILVIEDDARFARILYDIAHELDFDCIVAETAHEGLDLAITHAPDAIILDMKLPDYSGLWVLDRLKATAETRHIPVHIVSAHNNVQAALHKGAIGHLPKPVTRDNLKNVFNQLREKFTREKKRVLIVEDDKVQRESLHRLIADGETEVVTVSTGRDVLRKIMEETWDCLIVDLGLPDMTGFELLDQISHQDLASYPPIIVYTGKSLNREQEEKLRKYSQSVIIKGAKSPERLLDEVSLFLHRVESRMPPERQKLLKNYREREKAFEGRTILVADDDARNIFALTSALEQTGAAVVVARNGREAIQKLESHSEIDLVLMDVMMPEMDGIQATQEIRNRKDWKRLPIIAVTAKAMKDDQERCLEAGANDYLAKPIDLPRLLSLVRVWMPQAGRLT